MENATRVHMDDVKVGDYFKFTGHRIQEHLRDEWWKVTKRSDDMITGTATVELVNKRRQTARVLLRWGNGVKAMRWTPGTGA